MEDFDLLERPQAIVDAGIDLQHVQPRLHQGDGRQEVLALQAIRIKPVGRVIGGHHEDHTTREERFEQAAENHRIGNIRDMELVETEQPNFAGNALGDPGEGILFALQLLQLAMNVMHEGVEVHPPLATVRNRIVEAVHQKTLAASDATPEVNAARDFRWRQEAPQLAAAPDLERQQLVVQALQTLGGSTLSAVSREFA